MPKFEVTILKVVVQTYEVEAEGDYAAGAEVYRNGKGLVSTRVPYWSTVTVRPVVLAEEGG